MAEVKVAIHPHIRSAPKILELAVAFKTYKQGGCLPDNFGRDAPYDHPNTPEVVRTNLWHMHLSPSDKPFSKNQKQHDRTNRSGPGNIDRILVYTKGYLDESLYMLMAILEPNGHDLQKNHLGVMIPLAEKAAADFRDRY